MRGWLTKLANPKTQPRRRQLMFISIQPFLEGQNFNVKSTSCMWSGIQEGMLAVNASAKLLARLHLCMSYLSYWLNIDIDSKIWVISRGVVEEVMVVEVKTRGSCCSGGRANVLSSEGLWFDFPGLHVEVSLGKLLNPKRLQMWWSAPCLAANPRHQCMNVSMDYRKLLLTKPSAKCKDEKAAKSVTTVLDCVSTFVSV